MENICEIFYIFVDIQGYFVEIFKYSKLIFELNIFLVFKFRNKNWNVPNFYIVKS